MRIKNWDKFQHYKNGRGSPPWIKLYRDLLNDKQWFDLDPEAAKFLVSCWLIAAENDGQLPDADTLAFRLRLASKKIVDKYLSACHHWIIQDASDLLANGYQLATPETETETETEKKEKATRLRSQSVDNFSLPDWIEPQAWADFTAMRKAIRKPLTDGAKKLTVSELAKLKDAGHEPNAVLRQSVQRSWAGVFPIKAEITPPAPEKVASRAIDETQAYLQSQKQTPEERQRSLAAKRLAMSALKVVGA